MGETECQIFLYLPTAYLHIFLYVCLFSLYSTFKDSFTVKRYNLYCVQFSLKVKKLINWLYEMFK